MELYKSKRLFWFRIFLTVLSAYKDLDSFLRREEMWYLKFRSGSKKTPKNFIAGVGSEEKTRVNLVIFSWLFWPSLLLLQTTATSWVKFEREKMINLVLSGCSTSLLVYQKLADFPKFRVSIFDKHVQNIVRQK